MSHMSSEELILQVCNPRDPEGPVQAWVAVRIEAKDDEIDIHCTFQHCLIFDQYGSADVTYGADRTNRGLRLAGKCDTGFFEIPDEFQSLRIGCWIMSRIIDWAFQWPDTDVVPIWLGPANAEGVNRERRYRFWTACGYRFEAENIVHGYSLPCQVRDMTAPMKWQENITVMTTDAFQSHFNRRKRELAVLSQQHDWLKRHPVLYGLGRSLFTFCCPPGEADIPPEPAIRDSAPKDVFKGIQEVECDIHWHQRKLSRIEAAPFGHLLETHKEFMDIARLMGLFCLIAGVFFGLLMLAGT